MYYRPLTKEQLSAIARKEEQKKEQQLLQTWSDQLQREEDIEKWNTTKIYIAQGDINQKHTFKYTNPIKELHSQGKRSNIIIADKYFMNDFLKDKKENKSLKLKDYYDLRLLTVKDLMDELKTGKKNIPDRNALRSLYYFLSRLYEGDRDKELGMFRMTINLKDNILLSDLGLGLESLKKINEKYIALRTRDSAIDDIIDGYYLNYELPDYGDWHMHYTIFTDNRLIFYKKKKEEDIPAIMDEKIKYIINHWYKMAGRVIENIRGENSEKDIGRLIEKGKEWISINYSLPKYPLKYRYIDCLEDRNDQLDYLKYQCGMNKRTYDFKMENPNILLRTMSIR